MTTTAATREPQPLPAVGARLERGVRRPRDNADMSIDEPIYTASQGKNAPVFLDILRLYVPRGATGCDVTYGTGAFWTDDAEARVGLLHKSDLQDGVCLSALPYADGSMGFHVMDPPYMCGFFRPLASQKAQAKHSDFSDRYGNHNGTGYKGLYYHAAVEAIYLDGLREAWRVLAPGGIQITKVQDEVSSHKQHLTHCVVVAEAQRLGFEVLDLFVVVRSDKPHVKRIQRQEHARKNHSYFLVFRRPPPKRARPSNVEVEAPLTAPER